MQKVREKPGPLNASFLIYRRTAFHAAEEHAFREVCFENLSIQKDRIKYAERTKERLALKVYSEGNGKPQGDRAILSTSCRWLIIKRSPQPARTPLRFSRARRSLHCFRAPALLQALLETDKRSFTSDEPSSFAPQMHFSIIFVTSF